MSYVHKPVKQIDDWQAYVNRRALTRALSEISDPELEEAVSMLIEKLSEHLQGYRKTEKSARNDAITAVAAIFGGLESEQILQRRQNA